MKNGSKSLRATHHHTKVRRRYKKMPLDKAAEYVRHLSKADREQFWIDQTAPPPVRRRKREARQWIDLLTALTLNPPHTGQRAGDRWLTLAEGFAIWDQAHARLHLLNRDLWNAVKRVEWEHTERRFAMTREEWRADLSRTRPRRKRAWDEVRRFGPHPLRRDQIWAVLGVPSR